MFGQLLAGPWGQPLGADQIQRTLETMTRGLKSGSLLMPGLPSMPLAVAKATFSQSGSPTTGITFYDLEAPAKLLFPVSTPLRNEIPRVSGRGGIQAAWKAVTTINATGHRAGVSEGNRGPVIAVTTIDKAAAYRGIGLEANVTFEADYAAQGYQDVKALAVQSDLTALMVEEEKIILGGDNSLALGTTPTPTAVAVTSGGALADATYSVICVALTLDGFNNGTVAGGIQAQITRTNADGSVDVFGGGSARKSAAAAAVLSGGSGAGRVTATVTPVNGAVGYAWFWGAAGSEVLGAITSINSVNITAAATGTQTAASLGTGDNSTNSLIFDGLLTQAFASGSGAYIKTMATGTAGTGTPLTGDGAGGIVEIDAMLSSMWQNYRLGPDIIWMSAQEAGNIGKKVLAAGSAVAHQFSFAVDPGNIAGGIAVVAYRNKFAPLGRKSMAGQPVIQLAVHPNMPNGTILAECTRLPYPVSGVGNVRQIRERQSYYQIEWPLRTRKYEYGVYADEVLQHYFPACMGVITNIGNG